MVAWLADIHAGWTPSISLASTGVSSAMRVELGGRLLGGAGMIALVWRRLAGLPASPTADNNALPLRRSAPTPFGTCGYAARRQCSIRYTPDSPDRLGMRAGLEPAGVAGMTIFDIEGRPCNLAYSSCPARWTSHERLPHP